MKPIVRRAFALMLTLAWLAGSARAAGDADRQAIKKLMGDNFQNITAILVQLIGAHYEALPKEAEAIVQHANQLIATPPSTVQGKSNRDLFLSYATNLKISAEHLAVVTTELDRRDKEAGSKGEMNVDYLRAVAAEHFGAVVTNCVLCHNQFRRRAL